MMTKRTAILYTLLFLLFSLYQTSESFSFPDFSLGDLLKGSWVPEFIRNRRLTGSSTTTACNYPGVVAITLFGKTMLYTGIYSNGAIRIPDDALSLLKLANTNNPLTIQTDKGSSTAEVAKGAVNAVSNKDGTSTIKLTKDFSFFTCPANNAILYDKATMRVDISTCKIVSYGRQVKDLGAYDGVLRTSSLLENPVQSCCSYVLPNLLGKSPNLGHPNVASSPSSFSCAKSKEGICNGDIGAPIYCTDSLSSSEVVVGMVDSGTCSAGETFVSIDLTGGSLNGFSS